MPLAYVNCKTIRAGKAAPWVRVLADKSEPELRVWFQEFPW